MVNIRATIDAAHAQGRIRSATKTRLETTAKRLFYPSRTYDEILDHARREHVPESEIRAFGKCRTTGGIVENLYARTYYLLEEGRAAS
jgi:hypothetical protein